MVTHHWLTCQGPWLGVHQGQVVASGEMAERAEAPRRDGPFLSCSPHLPAFPKLPQRELQPRFGPGSHLQPGGFGQATYCFRAPTSSAMK